MSVRIGPYTLSSRLLLAPMAGVTDAPYRQLCHQFGAGLTPAEMISSDPSLQQSKKTQQRLLQADDPSPRSVQIVGTDPQIMANAAQYNVELGADIIDINMGCPAKKVCHKLAGSALMQNPKLVRNILNDVVKAVDIPVTLKMRTGWESNQKNAIEIAQIAEAAGISCITIHGRTRNQAYSGNAEYETIRQVKHAVKIPIIANGDIHNTEDVSFVFEYTQVDALMLGRITQGQPWIFSTLNDALSLDNHSKITHSTISPETKKITILAHISAIHRHYGTDQGVRIARKHIGWYLFKLIGHKPSLLKRLKQEIFKISDATNQLQILEMHLKNLV
ncbi:MAG: tRNA dihydrouridine synthase DusB [Cocleimonas sp.]